MGKQVRWWSFTGLSQPSDDLSELPSVPVDDDGGKEVQAGDPVVLRLGRPIADLTASVEADGTLERMMGLTFVEPHLRPSLEVGVAQPVEDEDRSLEAADFAQGKCKAVLAGIGRQFSQDLTGDEVAGRHAGRKAQDVRPVLVDKADFDPSGDQGLEDGR